MSTDGHEPVLDPAPCGPAMPVYRKVCEMGATRDVEVSPNSAGACGAAPSKFPVDPEILLAHDEGSGPGCEGKRQDDADGHLVREPGDPTDAEVGRDDGGGENDAEHQPSVKPPLDKQPLQCVVLELSPVFIAHGAPP